MDVGGKIHLSYRQLNGIKDRGSEAGRPKAQPVGAGRSGAVPLGRGGQGRRAQRFFQSDTVIEKNDASSQAGRSGTVQKLSTTTATTTVTTKFR